VTRHTLRLQLDNTIHEVELTADQAAQLEAGRAIAWHSPEVPDIRQRRHDHRTRGRKAPDS
jgi:hypothetical protein